MANVILGLVESYQPEALAPFINSLKATTFNGDLVFFVSNLPPATKSYLEEEGVITIPYKRLRVRGVRYPRELVRRVFSKRTGLHSLENSLIKALWHCQASRYFFYRDFLREHPKYENVLITDVRDVMFQSNPFSKAPCAPLQVFAEHPSIPIKKQVTNRDWIEIMYGSKTLNEIGDNSVICSGVTMGTREGMLTYLDHLTDLLRDKHEPHGFDQGVHNYLVHSRPFPGLKVCNYGEGPVINVGIAATETLKVDQTLQVLGNDDTPCSVVHQYDRHEAINDRVLKEFGLNTKS